MNEICTPIRDVEALLRHAEMVCAQRDARLTPLRRQTLATLAGAGAPVKAYDLLPMLGGADGPAKPATAYRALEFLQSMGLAHRVAGLNAYVACALGGGPHATALFICESCGFAAERRAPGGESDAPDGFHIQRSVIEHYGQCAACAADEARRGAGAPRQRPAP